MHECRYYYEKAFYCMRRRNSPAGAFRYFCTYTYCKRWAKKRKKNKEL